MRDKKISIDSEENISEAVFEDTKKAKKEKKPASLSKKERLKKLKYGSLSVVLTAVTVAIIVVINILVNVLADKFPISVDTTTEQYYDVSDETVKYLDTVKDRDIKIIFIGDKQELKNDNYYYKITTVAEKYQQQSEGIKVSYVDVDKTPGFESEYGNISLTNGDAIVSCDGRFRHLTSADFLTAQQDENSAQTTSESSSTTYNLNAEYALTMAIMVVTASDSPKATVITGHGETELEKLNAMLESNGFEVTTQSIVKEFDKDSDILIIAAPTKDFSEDDLKRVDDFLTNGGEYGKNVFYIASYNQPKLPNIETFLREWGVELSEGVVYESDSNVAFANMPYLCALECIDEKITLDIASTEATAYGYYGRPAKISSKLGANMENSIVLQHSETSKAGKITDGSFKTGDGEAYPYVAMCYTSVLKTKEDTSVLQSSLIFANSLQFFQDQLFERSYSANPDITANLVNTALGRGNSLSIPTKSLSAASLGITYTQANVIGVIVTIVIPVILLAVCIFVYVRRRFL